MGFTGTPRPPIRWGHATTELRDFAIISYAVDPERLAGVLPAGFEVDLFGGAGLVSAVPFLDRAFHFRWMPLVRIDCGQVNYRAYVRYRGVRGVWFFGTSLDHWLVAWPRVAWRMPWYRDRVRIDARWDGNALRSWSLVADGAWGSARCELTPGEANPIAGFVDLDHVREALCHPLVGWYTRADGQLGSYSVWHEALDPLPCRVVSARFDVFERLGLVAADPAAHSAFVQRSIHFDIHTPPGAPASG